MSGECSFHFFIAPYLMSRIIARAFYNFSFFFVKMDRETRVYTSLLQNGNVDSRKIFAHSVFSHSHVVCTPTNVCLLPSIYTYMHEDKFTFLSLIVLRIPTAARTNFLITAVDAPGGGTRALRGAQPISMGVLSQFNSGIRILRQAVG
jgi:hypothetical protein